MQPDTPVVVVLDRSFLRENYTCGLKGQRAMSAVATLLPAHRADLVVRPIGDEGQHVVKDPGTGAYFELGPKEHFLLTRLDGSSDPAEVCAAFERQFGQPLSPEELTEFVDMARERKLLRDAPAASVPTKSKEAELPEEQRQSILYWRKSIFDPDRLCNWLEPRLRFFWTRGFLFFSASCILLAAVIVCVNRDQVASSFVGALRWETAVWAWLTILAVTLLHEFAHALTCKHHGGEVHEIGFLMMFFMPCFYANVSDAWLFKERSKRLWVTFAGGYFELFLWALAVFVWRLTLPGSFPNYLAFIVLTACGLQTLLNFNPLMKLDGYYLLSDWKGISNLKQRASTRSYGHLRRLLWGAPAPTVERHGRFLTTYGLTSWLFSLCFLTVSLIALGHIAGGLLGWVGLVGVGFLGIWSLRGLLRGLFEGEVTRMILTRHRRTAVWLLILSGIPTALAMIEMQDRASGTFQVRAATRAEVRAPVAGFIREVHFDEGERVSPGTALFRLEVPEHSSRLAQKRADLRQSEARLRLLQAEVVEQRGRVERGERWRDQGKVDLERAEKALVDELVQLDRQIDQAKAEVDAARVALQRTRIALARGAASLEEISEAERRQRSGEAKLAQAQAERRARESKGTVESKLELDRREHKLTEDRATLTSLETGPRAKEIEAEQAKLESLREEERYLLSVQEKLIVYSPVVGIVTTPRLKEKVGQFVREGDLICLVEEPEVLEADIAIAEQDVARVQIGQSVALKARALPNQTFTTRVDRIAPAANKGEGQNNVTVYCRLEKSAAPLPGMTGNARIYGESRSVGGFLIDRSMRYLRTEFWW
jgi:putative peptide zinc metalloprotease protein